MVVLLYFAQPRVYCMDITVHKDNVRARVLMKGQFTFADNSRFRDLLVQLNDNPPGELILDVAKLEYIDSAALGMLLLLRDHLSDAGTEIILAGANGQVLKIFELSRFDELFELL